MIQTKTYFSRKPSKTIVLSLILALLTLACGIGDVVQISFGNPTPTRTRTPRPTFTPRVELTATPEDTATPLATDTLAATATTTRRPTSIPVTRTPTKPPPPTAPQFPAQLINSYRCDQGSEVWEIIGSVRRSTGAPIFLENYILGILSPDGRIIKTSDPSMSDEAKVMALDISCQQAKQFPYNIKIDATELRGKGPFIIRLMRSRSDATPLAQDVQVDFMQPVRWFVFYNAAGPN